MDDEKFSGMHKHRDFRRRSVEEASLPDAGSSQNESRKWGSCGGRRRRPAPTHLAGAEAPLACVRPCLLSVCGSSPRTSRPSVYILSFRPRGLERDGPRARSYVRHTRAQISRQNSDGSTTVGRRYRFEISNADQ